MMAELYGGRVQTAIVIYEDFGRLTMNFEQFKDNVKDRSDIIEVVNSYIPLKRVGGKYHALCPFHSEKTPSFYVDQTRQAFYCFGCQKGGDVIQFVMDYEGLDFMGAMGVLARRAGIEVPSFRRNSKTSTQSSQASSRKEVLYELHEKLTQWYRKNLRADAGASAEKYVRSRIPDHEATERFGIGYAPDSWHDTMEWGRRHGFSPELMFEAGILSRKQDGDAGGRFYDRFRDRVMFPIWNEQGRVIAFSGRTLSAETRGGKYVNSSETPIFRKSTVLYGLHLARAGIRESGYVLLCEGQMDVIACHSAGLTNCVAPMGTAFTEQQARILKRHTDEIVILFDADSAGMNAVTRSIDAILASGLSPRVVTLTEGEDPDSLLQQHGPQALQQRIRDAVDYFLFRLDLETKRHNARVPDGKAKIVEAVLADVCRVESYVKQAEYCRIVANRLKISEHAVNRDLRRIAGRNKRGRKVSPEQEQTPESKSIPDSNQSHAESVLLEIAIHHGVYAHRLLEELPVRYISDTPVGQALNEVLAHTEQGEWSEAGDILLEHVDQYRSPLVAKALFDPEYGAEASKKKVQKAYTDCLYHKNQGLAVRGVNREIEQLRNRISNSTDTAEKRELISQLHRLVQENRLELIRKWKTSERV